MMEIAETCLMEFESRRLTAPAYIPPQLFSPSVIVRSLPVQVKALLSTVHRRSHRESLKYTNYENSYSVSAKVQEAFRLRRNLWRLHRRSLITKPIDGPYVFFGLHMQPESSIDVMAHFFANQPRVIELLARSLPPTHRLLVKLHKSDAPNYAREWLERIELLPGVQVVSPYSDTFELIRRADLVVAIQGTIGLEAALLGKPVLFFGDSAVQSFPSASTIGRTIDLPRLIRQKIAEERPDRARIVDAYAKYLAPYYPASLNDWQIVPTNAEITGYVKLFGLLESYVKRDSR
jgi:CDP-glycerol glycerophosphotransferase (TagB/SpsB family)